MANKPSLIQGRKANRLTRFAFFNDLSLADSGVFGIFSHAKHSERHRRIHCRFPSRCAGHIATSTHNDSRSRPEATEAIKYAIPTFVFHGNLVHFAGYKNHIGFYATPGAHEDFAQELAPYKQGKGSVQFPIDQPMPLSLIARMVKYRMQKNLDKLAGKKK